MNILKPIRIMYRTLISAKKYISQNSLLFSYDPSTIKDNSTSLISLVNTGNNGTLQSSIVVSASPPVFDLNGSSDYISTTTQYVNPQTYTIAFWFRTNVASGNKIIGFENTQTGTVSTNYDRQLYVGTDGKLYYGLVDAGTLKYITTSFRVTDNKFRYVVLTATSGSQSLYIDDVLIGTQTASASEVSTGYWRIGSYILTSWTNGANGYFDGQIGTIQLYNRFLSRPEITQNYQAGKSTYGNNVSFSYTGSLQRWVVPNNVYSITINAIAARGGDGGSNANSGGSGSNAICNASVTPGQTLFIIVGGYPGTSETAMYGFGGNGGLSGATIRYGGAGGGLSGVFTDEILTSSDILIVAGGGGGGAGLNDNDGGNGALTSTGSGSDGTTQVGFGHTGGYGATTSNNGLKGVVYDTNSTQPTNGSNYNGGLGGTGSLSSDYGGGGGGAGYLGGGGGAGGGSASGGGGGGSTFAQSYTIFGQGNDVGHGSVNIFYNQTNDEFDAGHRYYRWRISDTRDAANTISCQASEFVFQDQFGNDQRMYVKTISNPNGSSNSGEDVSKLIDGSLSTKWLDNSFQTNNDQSVVLFDYGIAQKRNYNFYSWATGNDATGRDPKSWVIEASDDQAYWWITDYVYNYTATTERQTWQTARSLINLGNPNQLVLFLAIGSISTWTVPAGVSTIYVNLTGAEGQAGNGGMAGGMGAQISTDLTVTPNSTLYIVVGKTGNGKTADFGYGGNGGDNTGASGLTRDAGCGGGLTGIFTSNTPSIANALAIAGGGGGGGGGSGVNQPCNGGSAGINRDGSGQDGNSNTDYLGVRGRKGLNSSAGAAGNPFDTNTVDPTAGNGLQGGNGGWTSNSAWNGGGGGGGGYYAGGGGAAGGNAVGGGGSGGTYSTGTIVWNSGNSSGDGWLTISY